MWLAACSAERGLGIRARAKMLIKEASSSNRLVRGLVERNFLYNLLIEVDSLNRE